MKFAHIYPDDDKLMPLWLPFSKHEFVDQTCTPDCDYIYCASVTQIGRALYYAQEFNKEIICWVWDLPFNWREWCRNDQDYAENKFRDSDISFKLDALKACNLVISASNSTAEALETHGITSDRLYHFVGTKDILRHTGTEKSNTIIQVSRFCINKRFHMTLDMFKEVSQEHPDWSLVFIGPDRTPYCVELENRIKAEEIKNVEILINPSRFETLQRIAKAKILVSPSLHEGWGITPVESAILGTIPVMADIPVVEEYWSDNTDAYIFLKNDIEDYVDCVEMAIGGWSKGASVIKIGIEDLTPESFAKRFDTYLEGKI
jgi:glycosyltransferase involved in cell wall biosynthesis